MKNLQNKFTEFFFCHCYRVWRQKLVFSVVAVEDVDEPVVVLVMPPISLEAWRGD